MAAKAHGCKSFVYVANSSSGDISVYSLDATSGDLRCLDPTTVGGAVGALAVSPDRRFLYASIRTQPYSLASFAIDAATGNLDLLSIVPAADTMTYLAVDATGRFLLGASYSGNLVSVNPIGPDGFAQAEPVALTRPGRNPHSVRCDPSNRFVFVPNLGSDQVSQFLFDEKTGSLAPNRPAAAPFPHLAGPRHFCFSPNSRFAYVLTELSGEVACCAFDAASGTLAPKQFVSIMPPDSQLEPDTYIPPTNARRPDAGPKIWAADIRITPNGKFLYASERTTSALACFTADTFAGTLAYTESVTTEKQPRSFAICPRGRFLVAAGEASDHVASYAIDQEKGTLRQLSRRPAGKTPNWVEIVEFR